jgi:anti-sigma factor RsiW
MMCQHVIGFLMDYLNRELSAEQQSAFELHIAQCPSCINYLNSYRKTIELGRAVSEEDADLEMPEELVQAVLDSSGGRA